jgi:hypothetical protein
MRLTASDIVSNHRPSFCDRRVLLRHRGEPETPGSPFDEVLRVLGQQHERHHVDSFGEFTDIGMLSRRAMHRDRLEPIWRLGDRPSILNRAEVFWLQLPLLLDHRSAAAHLNCRLIDRNIYRVNDDDY